MNADMLAANTAAHWVQAGAVVAVSLSAMRLLNVRAPAYWLLALQLTLLTSLLLPVVQPYVEAQPPQAPAFVTDAAIVHTKFFDAKVASQPQPLPLVDPTQAFLLIIVAGTVLRLSWLTYGVIRLMRFNRAVSVVPTPGSAVELEAELGVSPRYIQQTGGRGPWTFGFVRATVAVPTGFDALVPTFQRAVICHELVHIKRRDIVVALVEELVVAILWFHPWVWLLRARIRTAREQVVDARVIELLGDRDEYVRCLVNLSGHDLAPHFSQAGAGMLRPRELRARVDAIFQEAHMSRRRLVAVTFALLMTVGATTYVAGAVLPMRAAAEPEPTIPDLRALPQTPAATTPTRLNPATDEPINIRFSNARLRDVLAFLGHATSIVFTGYEASFDEGRPVTIDASAPLEELLDRLLTPSGLMYTVTGPRTIVIARNPLAEVRQASAMFERERERRQINMVYPEYPPDALERGIKGSVIVDITVNPTGDVTTVAVASGPQELRASAFKAALALKYTKGTSTTAMKIAFEYLLTDTSWGVKINGASPNIGLRRLVPQNADAIPTSAEPDATGAYRVGGDVQPPKKIKDMPPQYPAIAQQARVQGVVIMEVRIDEHGNVSDVRTLRSIPLLDQAAIDAVKQWQYEPPMRNGIAVPVKMTVTVNFSLRELIQLQVFLPDGSVGSTELVMGTLVEFRPTADDRFRFRFTHSPERNEATASVFAEDGSTHLGDVVLLLNGPVVQLPTHPSFGMQFLGVR